MENKVFWIGIIIIFLGQCFAIPKVLELCLIAILMVLILVIRLYMKNKKRSMR